MIEVLKVIGCILIVPLPLLAISLGIYFTVTRPEEKQAEEIEKLERMYSKPAGGVQ